MALPITAIKAALYQWLTDTASIPVVWQFQNAPEPTETFFSVNPMVASRLIGLYDAQVLLSDGTTQIIPYREIKASVNACGPNALAKLSQAQDKLSFESLYKAWFLDRGITCESSEIRNISGLKGSRFELRYQIDLTLTCYGSDNGGDGTPLIDDAGYATSLEWSGDIDDLEISTQTIP